MKLLTAIDGTKISVRHVVTVANEVHDGAYRAAGFSYYLAKKAIGEAEAEGNGKLREQLIDAFKVEYPNGGPQVEDYLRTKVGCTDGRMYWVKESFDAVRLALLDA